MNKQPWIEHLEMLIARFSHLGIGADANSMTEDELHGLYRFLLHRVEE